MAYTTRLLATYLFRNSVFGVVALIIAILHVIRPSIVLLTGGLIAAGFGIVLYNIGLSGIAIGLLILGFARPAPATAGPRAGHTPRSSTAPATCPRPPWAGCRA